MDFNNPPPISLVSIAVNLILGLAMTLILSLYYAKLGDSLSNRSKFAPILPLLTSITLLVITIVKSSLALSLGLVGALSIVRFRTAIKDPEELIYLFFSIAIGLGLGADQRIPTLIAFAIIMGYLLLRSIFVKSFKLSPHNTLYMNINVPLNENKDDAYTFIHNIIGEEFRSADLRRYDTDGKELRLIFYFNVKSTEPLIRLTTRIQKKYENAVISIVEQNNLLGG